MIFKFLKFGTVGLTGFFIDFGLTYFIKEKLHWNKFLANSIGFTVAVLNNYVWNRLWTFNNHNQRILQQLSLFLVISVVGLGVNNFFLYFFNEKKKIYFYHSKFIAICIVFCWNFFMNSLITFK